MAAMLPDLPLDDSTVEQLRAVLRQHGVSVAYLFGSVACGDAGPLGDVDVAVLFGRRLSREEAWDATLRLGADVPIALRREADLVVPETAPPTLRFAAIDEGLLILNDDDDRRVEFEARTISEYLDTAHLRSVYDRYLCGRLREGAYVSAT
jgi:uncharacterized protein